MVSVERGVQGSKGMLLCGMTMTQKAKTAIWLVWRLPNCQRTAVRTYVSVGAWELLLNLSWFRIALISRCLSTRSPLISQIIWVKVLSPQGLDCKREYLFIKAMHELVDMMFLLELFEQISGILREITKLKFGKQTDRSFKYNAKYWTYVYFILKYIWIIHFDKYIHINILKATWNWRSRNKTEKWLLITTFVMGLIILTLLTLLFSKNSNDNTKHVVHVLPHKKGSYIIWLIIYI